MARIAEFLKLPVVLSALLASVGAATAQAREPSSGNCEPLDKNVAAAQPKGKILDAHLQGNRYRIKYLDENGRVRVIEIDASGNVRICAGAVGGDVRRNHGRWFPPEIVLPEP